MKKLLLCVIFVLCSTSAYALPFVPNQAHLSFSGTLTYEAEVHHAHGSVILSLLEIPADESYVKWGIEMYAANMDVSLTGYFDAPHDGVSFVWNETVGIVDLVENVFADYYIASEDHWVDPTFDSDHELPGEVYGIGTDIFPSHIDFSFDSGGGEYSDAAFSVDFYSQPVPEPATLLLLGTGILGMIGYKRKSRRIP